MISMRHNGDFEKVKGKFGTSKLKPLAVAQYNRFMGGIDKSNQMTSY